MKQFWLSFSEPAGFKGVAIVEADSLPEALQKTWDLEINPGGSVSAIQIDPSEHYGPEWLNRLIVRPEINEIGVSTRDLAEMSGTVH